MAASRLARVREWLRANPCAAVGEPEFERIGAELEIPEEALRKLLRECAVPLAPLVEGVRQDTWEHLGRTLIALQREYETGDQKRRQQCRRLVITAKDHAQFAARRKPGKHEVVECLRVWLENPPVFESWWRLTSRTRENTDTAGNRAGG